jgi:Tfp pilus assembly ATPase PilU
MKKFAAAIRAMPLVMLLGLPGSAQATPLQSVSDLMKLLESQGSSSVVQPAHCRPFVHTHRRCVRWRRGVCRSWRTWRHRC